MFIKVTEDYPAKTAIEKKILGKYFKQNPPCHKVKVLLAWRRKIDHAYISKFRNLKAVIRYGVGFDNVDLKVLKKRKIMLFNNPIYGVDEVSDTSLAMALNFCRRIGNYDQLTKKILNKKKRKKNSLIKEIRRLKEMNFGIIGAGNIGSVLIKKTLPIFKNVAFYDPYKGRNFEKKLKCKKFYSLKNFLKWSDVVSLHITLNKKTHSLIDDKFLKYLGKKKILINTSRYKLIKNIKTLKNALDKKTLIGIGLDIELDEIDGKDMKMLKQLSKSKKYGDKILLSPHVAYYSKESFVDMRINAIKTALNVFKGRYKKNRII